MSMAWDLRASHRLRQRAIERVKGVHHTTVIDWVEQVGQRLPDAYEPETIPEVGELDESDTPGEAGGLMSVTAPRAGVLAGVLHSASRTVLLYPPYLVRECTALPRISHKAIKNGVNKLRECN